MTFDVVDRYIHDVLNARRILAERRDAKSRLLAQSILTDIAIYLADHVEDVVSARHRLALRSDREGRAMLACVDTLLQSFADANDAAGVVLDKASRV